MTRVRFAFFGVILAGAVALMVSTLVAQAPAPPPADSPFEWQAGPFGDGQARRLFMLDGRGSQLGVTVEDLTADDLKNAAGVTAGARIEDLDTDGPAAKAGLRQGDIVVEFDGERVRSARQFSRLVQETVGGRTVKLGIVRGGQRQTVDVVPEDRGMAFGIDADRIGRDVARSMRELGPRLRELEPRLRELEPRFRELEPRYREFQWDGPAFNFNFDGMFPLTMRGRLGVQLESLTPQLATYFGAKDGGVLVMSVTEGSAAEKAGLKAGDVITSINGDRVRDYEALASELRSAEGEVTIGIVRDKKESTLKATLESAARTLLRPRPRRPA